jgi:hypothetical protein
MASESYELREPEAAYNDDFLSKKGNIELENGYFWNVNNMITDR